MQLVGYYFIHIATIEPIRLFSGYIDFNGARIDKFHRYISILPVALPLNPTIES